METRTPEPDLVDLATTLLTRTPGWARVGLTAPDARLREAAAAELVQTIVASLRGRSEAVDVRQMALPL